MDISFLFPIGEISNLILDKIVTFEDAHDKRLEVDIRDFVLTLRKHINLLDSDSTIASKGYYDV